MSLEFYYIERSEIPYSEWRELMDNYSKKKENNNYIAYFNEDGKLHRLDGPAVEWNNGNKSWLICERYHRVNSPAYEDDDDNKEWYLYGIIINEDKHRKYMNSLFGVLLDG